MLLCQQGLFEDMEVVLSYVSGFFPMNSWCDKLSQVSAWYPLSLLITAGLVYWVLKTGEMAWSLVSSRRSPRRAPHTDLALPTGLTLRPPFPCPQLSRPGAREHPPLLPCSSSLTSNRTPSPITPVSCELWNPFTSATATYLAQVPINSYLDYSNSSQLLSQPV